MIRWFSKGDWLKKINWSKRDRKPPTAPTGLTSSSVGTSGFTLTWTASTDNIKVKEYEVYRGGSYQASTTSTSYSFSGLSSSTTYSVYVIAVDVFGNKSVASSSLSVTTDSNASPPAIGTVTLTVLNIQVNSINIRVMNINPQATAIFFRYSYHPGADLFGTGYFENEFSITPGTTSADFALTGLILNQEYSMTVTAHASGYQTSWTHYSSPYYVFKTQSS